MGNKYEVLGQVLLNEATAAKASLESATNRLLEAKIAAEDARTALKTGEARLIVSLTEDGTFEPRKMNEDSRNALIRTKLEGLFSARERADKHVLVCELEQGFAVRALETVNIRAGIFGSMVTAAVANGTA
jgi:hypothetical protein